LAEIPLEDTPIFVKLVQEYAAHEKFEEIFGEDPEPETHKLRGGSITVYGSPIAE
jgi:hypothetical protein